MSDSQIVALEVVVHVVFYVILYMRFICIVALAVVVQILRVVRSGYLACDYTFQAWQS